MLLTSAGLWIASDNEGSQTCGFVSKLSGICFLPTRKRAARHGRQGPDRDTSRWFQGNHGQLRGR